MVELRPLAESNERRFLAGTDMASLHTETAGPLYPDLETVELSVRCRKRMRVAQDHGQSLLSADQRVGCGATATNRFALQS